MQKPIDFNNINVIIWDVDGTFYQITDEIWGSFQTSIYDRLSEYLDMTLKSVISKYIQRYKKLGSNTKTIDSFGMDGKKMIDEVIQSNVVDLLTYDELLVEMFEQLSHRRHVILTNADEKMTLKKLKRLGLKSTIFEKIFATYDMDYVKPDPRVYQDIVNYLKEAAERCLVVGDRVETDLIPAKELGMKTCLVWGKSDLADVCVDEVYKLKSFLV